MEKFTTLQRGMIGGLLLLATGCGGPSIAPVSGRVTLDDKPLANATVIFYPQSEAKDPGPYSQAKTDADGRFTLQTVMPEGPGAVVGNHVVKITAYEGSGKQPSSGLGTGWQRKSLLGPEYNTQSKLTFDVPPGGSMDADFRLKSETVE